ncbi:MAG: TonB-dependent hemoglobin/transferrin/lactoferrin family receptor, partial [Akkermansiaceae bacterium]|nr:TonB-dependent hemoglobin/transferrin/lactoferrin family receptor [Akkermansiaceae bacterium]
VRTQFFSANQSLASQVGGAFKTGKTSVMFLVAGREGEETENNGHLPPNPAEFTSLSSLLKVEHEIGDSTFKAAFETFDRHSVSNVRSATISDFPVFTKYVYNEQQLERQRASLRWEWKPKDAWITEVDTMAYWQHAGSASENQSASKPVEINGVPIPGTERTRQQRIDFDTDISGFSSIARKEFGHENAIMQTFLAGLDVSLEQSANKFTRHDSGSPDDVNRTSFAPTDTTRAGLFLQDEISIQKKWIITPGIRFDYQEINPDPNQAYLDRLASLGRFGQTPPEDYNNFAISPRLNVAWKPKDYLQVYGSYARGVRNPSAEELSMIFDHPPSGGSPAGTLTVPNPSLKEEESDAFELGVKGDGKAGRAQASVYYTKYRNFIENGVQTGETDDEGRDIVTTVNRGKAEIYGFELSGVLKPSYWWEQASGWEIGGATGKSIGNNLTDDLPLNTVDPWKTVAFVGYDDPGEKFGLRLTGTYTAKVTRVDDSTNQGKFFRPPSWFTLDLAGYWHPTETLTIHAGLNNIFDEKYWSWSSVRRGNGHLGGDATDDRSTAPGRNFSVSITKTF